MRDARKGVPFFILLYVLKPKVMEKYRTLNGRVLVERVAEEQKTATGIIIPEKEGRGKLLKGKVIQVDETIVPVKVGEIVYYRHGIGLEVLLESKPYLLLKAHELELVQN